jgi:6-phosphofructokinase 1
MKKLAVLTTGGDCPGLNAAIRAVVRSGIYYGYEMYGVPRGYDGLMSGNFIPMNSSSVSNIIQRGGTILKSARSEAFKTAEGRIKANEHLKQNGIDALVIIGGDGSLRGAQALEREHGVKIVGIPKTIDNDISGTDFAIGYDTALNTVVEAIDKIRDTADSHDRLFFVEVMGRDAGTIALLSGVASGAEAILIPETRTAIEQVVAILERGWQRKKSSCIVIVAEGDEEGAAVEVANKVKEKFNHYDTKICVLGHIQRGGSPTCADRVLASRLGVAAIQCLHEGKAGVMVGVVKDQIQFTPLAHIKQEHKINNTDLLSIAEILSH